MIRICGFLFKFCSLISHNSTDWSVGNSECHSKMLYISFSYSAMQCHAIEINIIQSIQKIPLLITVCSIFYNLPSHHSNAFRLVAFTTVTFLYHDCLVYICIFTFLKTDQWTLHFYCKTVRLPLSHIKGYLTWFRWQQHYLSIQIYFTIKEWLELFNTLQLMHHSNKMKASLIKLRL